MRSPVWKFAVQARWVAIAGLLLTLIAFLDLAHGQNAPAPVAPVQIAPLPDAAPPPESPAAPPVPIEKPGLFEALGRWIDRNNENVRDQLRGAQEHIDGIGDRTAERTREFGNAAADIGKGAVEATKGAVDSVAKLPISRVIQGHERCALAANGAPDCLAAADALCRKNGFSSGKSVDFTSAEECQRLAASREPECKTVTFISRAMCQ